MGTERALVVAEHLVADRERRDATADRLDHPANSLPRTVARGLVKPGEQSHEEGLGGPARAVGPIHRRGVNLDEYLVVPMVGLSTSTIRTTSGGPYLVWTAACIPAQ